MRLEHGIKRRDKSPSRLDTFLRGIEEERDYYKKELEKLQHIIQRRTCSVNYSAREKTSIFKCSEKVIPFIRVIKGGYVCACVCVCDKPFCFIAVINATLFIHHFKSLNLDFCFYNNLQCKRNSALLEKLSNNEGQHFDFYKFRLNSRVM